MKEFVTAAAAAVDEDDEAEIEVPIEFAVDDATWTAYRPTSGQIAMMLSGGSAYASGTDRIAAMIDFFLGCLDKDSRSTAARRLMDREDDFEVEQVMEIVGWLMEEWNGRPTSPSSGSSRSRRNGGRKSTASSPVAELIPSV